ncbi:MAG: hypothetical protein AABZ60_20150 [Planctomycetota bacterium]
MDSHGSIQTTASYLVTNDFPDYAVMFYHPTEHEQLTAIKYGNFEAGYHNLKEIRESLNGMPFEFYIPSSSMMDPGVGRNDIPLEGIPLPLAEIIERESANEIKKAQEQIRMQRTKITVEETLLIKRKRSITIEQTSIR